MDLLVLYVSYLLFHFRLRLLCLLFFPNCHMYMILLELGYCQVCLLYLLVSFWCNSIVFRYILALLCCRCHHSYSILHHCIYNLHINLFLHLLCYIILFHFAMYMCFLYMFVDFLLHHRLLLVRYSLLVGLSNLYSICITSCKIICCVIYFY